MAKMTNRGGVRILYHSPTAARIFRKKITGVKLFQGLIQGRGKGLAIDKPLTVMR